MYRSKTLSLLLGVVALCSLHGFAQAAQNKKPQLIMVRVDSVLAADTHEGTDTRLTPAMASRLKALFGYTTYRLVKHQQEQTACGRMISFDLPGGHILHIAPRAIVGGMIAMELVLFDGGRPVMTTDLKLMNHGILIIGGSRYQQGMLITTIGAATIGNGETRELPRPSPEASR